MRTGGREGGDPSETHPPSRLECPKIQSLSHRSSNCAGSTYTATSSRHGGGSSSHPASDTWHGAAPQTPSEPTEQTDLHPKAPPWDGDKHGRCRDPPSSSPGVQTQRREQIQRICSRTIQHLGVRKPNPKSILPQFVTQEPSLGSHIPAPTSQQHRVTKP